MQRKKPEKSKIYRRDKDFYKTIHKYFIPEAIGMLIFASRQANILFIKNFEKLLLEHDLNNSQWAVLYILMLEGSSMCPNELARFLPIENTSLSPVLDKLEERALIKRYRSNKDKRTVKVYLTEKGYALLKAANPPAIKFAKAIYGSLSPDEEKALISIERKIRDNVLLWNMKDPARAENVLDRLSHLKIKSRPKK